MSQAAEASPPQTELPPSNGRARLPKTISVGLIAMIVGSPTAWFLLRPRVPMLLESAVPLGDIAPFKKTSEFSTCQWYWAANDRIFVLREDEASLYGSPGNSSQTRSAVIIDTGKRMESPIPGFGANLESLNKAHGRRHLIPLALSPDGSSLLWLSNHVRPSDRLHLCSIYSTSIDGQFRSVHTARGSSYQPIVAWLPDSRSWARLTFNLNGVGLQKYNVVDAQTGSFRSHSLPANRVGGVQLGVTRRGEVLICNPYQWDKKDALYLAAIDVQNPTTTPRPFTTRIPPHRRVLHVSYSPVRDRLAVITMPDSTIVGSQNVFQRLASRVGLRSVPAYMEVWTCRSDGSDLRLLGAVGRKKGDPVWPMGSTSRWSPDGSKIAFTFKQKLYFAAVD